MDYIGVSAQQVGVLTTIEMLAATLCIIPASHYADRYRREPFVIVTFIMFTLFPISLLMSRSFSALVIAFTIRGLKEFGDTSRKALILGYSDPGRRGQMIGSYYLVRDLVVSTSAEFSRSSGPRNGWNDFLYQNDSPKQAISPERFEKAVGDATKSLELAMFFRGPGCEYFRIRI
jgi:hypothetical protein